MCPNDVARNFFAAAAAVLCALWPFECACVVCVCLCACPIARA